MSQRPEKELELLRKYLKCVEPVMLEMLYSLEVLLYLEKKFDPAYKECWEIAPWFFTTVQKSALNNVVLVLCILFEKDSKRSLFRYLDKLKRIPKSHCPVTQAEIASDVDKIGGQEAILKKLKNYRDKFIAHRDKQPFDNPQTFWERNPFPLDEVEKLANITKSLVQFHSGRLLDSCHNFEVAAHLGLDKVFKLMKQRSDLARKVEEKYGNRELFEMICD